MSSLFRALLVALACTVGCGGTNCASPKSSDDTRTSVAMSATPPCEADDLKAFDGEDNNMVDLSEGGTLDGSRLAWQLADCGATPESAVEFARSVRTQPSDNRWQTALDHLRRTNQKRTAAAWQTACPDGGEVLDALEAAGPSERLSVLVESCRTDGLGIDDDALVENPDMPATLFLLLSTAGFVGKHEPTEPYVAIARQLFHGTQPLADHEVVDSVEPEGALPTAIGGIALGEKLATGGIDIGGGPPNHVRFASLRGELLIDYDDSLGLGSDNSEESDDGAEARNEKFEDDEKADSVEERAARAAERQRREMEQVREKTTIELDDTSGLPDSRRVDSLRFCPDPEPVEPLAEHLDRLLAPSVEREDRGDDAKFVFRQGERILVVGTFEDRLTRVARECAELRRSDNSNAE